MHLSTLSHSELFFAYGSQHFPFVLNQRANSTPSHIWCSLHLCILLQLSTFPSASCHWNHPTHHNVLISLKSSHSFPQSSWFNWLDFLFNWFLSLEHQTPHIITLLHTHLVIFILFVSSTFIPLEFTYGSQHILLFSILNLSALPTLFISTSLQALVLSLQYPTVFAFWLLCIVCDSLHDTIVPMPMPRSPNAPLFKGQCVTDLLDCLKVHAAATNVPLNDLLSFLLCYCHRWVQNIINSSMHWTQCIGLNMTGWQCNLILLICMVQMNRNQRFHLTVYENRWSCMQKLAPFPAFKTLTIIPGNSQLRLCHYFLYYGKRS